jgi:hypothetical protein
MRRLVYQISLGETPAFYQDCIASVERYCDRLNVDHFIQTEPILKIQPVNSARSDNALRLGYLPIYEKENAFGYLDSYDQIAIIDADVFVRPHAPNLFDELRGATFAGALERDMPLTPAYLDKVQKYSKAQHGPLSDVDWLWDWRGCSAFFNMGVMLFSSKLADYMDGQTPKEFIQRKEFERFVNGEGDWKWSTDQTLLNYWIKKTGMLTRDLDWKWNGLFNAVHNVDQAWFIHLFLSDKLSNVRQIIANL